MQAGLGVAAAGFEPPPVGWSSFGTRQPYHVAGECFGAMQRKLCGHDCDRRAVRPQEEGRRRRRKAARQTSLKSSARP